MPSLRNHIYANDNLTNNKMVLGGKIKLRGMSTNLTTAIELTKAFLKTNPSNPIKQSQQSNSHVTNPARLFSSSSKQPSFTEVAKEDIGKMNK